MSKSIINLNIDVTKIDKSALYKGDKGTYLNISLFLDESGEPDQYGNHGFMTQDIGKARRDAGEKGKILGNAKFVKREQSSQAAQSRPSTQNGAPPPASHHADDDDIPF